MYGDTGNPKDVQRAFAMAAVGIEIVIPTLLGWWLDSYLNSGPWGALVGGTIGFSGGIWHMVRLSKLDESSPDDRPSPPRTGAE
jgi:F0F1-type ATP synthase assembly protein I